MAQIRIVDDWLRSPASPPSHYRSVMVIAEKWAEQRVLMRAYAQSRDQTMPTIMLHAVELAIGPAGLDVNGPWGIHVGSNPGMEAQAVKAGLEDAARRMAGSKGNPPRLVDESNTFDREPTGNWAPGTPRVLPQRPDQRAPAVEHVAAAAAARVPQAQMATYIPQAPAAQHVPQAQTAVVAPSNPELRKTPVPRRSSGKTRPPPTNVRTALGYTSGSGAQSAIVKLGLAPQISARLGRLVDRVVPADFSIDAGERRVLNALGEHALTARSIGHMLDIADATTFMEELTSKLERYGLGDLIEPGEPQGGEPTYRMRR
ncbi:MAG TPA: hypothetical protein VFV99_03215 [Kofleriaceae bacterium]|nr:hypothetical protein [Kofleriaceae bacterium]